MSGTFFLLEVDFSSLLFFFKICYLDDIMKKFNLKTGKLGEAIAREYLEKKGYQILEQNVRSKFGEIYLVGKNRKELVVVEVRTKIGDRFGSPEESLDKKSLASFG